MGLLTGDDVDEVDDLRRSESVGGDAGVDSGVIQFKVTDAQSPASEDPEALPSHVDHVTVLLPLEDGLMRRRIDGTAKTEQPDPGADQLRPAPVTGGRRRHDRWT